MHEFRDVKKILVIKLRHIGDVLLTVPVFRALRENFPGALISALVYSGTEEVLAGNQLIDEIIVFGTDIKKMPLLRRYGKELDFLRMLRDKGFDMAVDLTSGDRPAIISLVSGARYRLAYDPGRDGFFGKKHLYTHLAKKDGSEHMVLQNLNTIRQFGIDTENHAVDLFIPEDAQAFARKVFEQNSIRGSDSVVHVHPTSRWLFKCWGDECMAEVIDWLTDNRVRVIVTSSPDRREMDKAQRVLSLTKRKPSPVDLCGRTTIKQLAAISSLSDLFLGVDSAPMHIAAAAGTPVVVLFGPTGDAQWGPWGRGHTVFTRGMRCTTCDPGTCDGVVVRKCLAAITKDEVIKALAQALRERGSFQGSREEIP